MIFKNGERTALLYGEEKLTYGELKANIGRFADLYKNESASKVVIFSENRIGWLFAFYSAWVNKAVPVPIDFMSATDDVAYILNDCQPEIIFVSKDKKQEMEAALEQTNHAITLYVIDDYEASAAPLEGADSYLEIDHEARRQDTAVIIYTSGTTGNPKGVMLSFENLIVNIHAVHKYIEIYKKEDRILMLLPLHHILPLMGTVVLPLFLGASIAIAPSMAPEDIINTLQRNRVSIIVGVPRLYSAIYKGIKTKIEASKLASFLYNTAKRINSYGFSRFIFKSVHKKFGGAVKYMVCGGAALDKEVGEGYKILGFEILEGFGMTEAAPMITFTRPGKVKVGSPGHPLPEAQVDIRMNEIVVKGPNIMQGYYNRPEETQEVLKDGWLYTGDLGYFDEEGFLHITGRKKEIIVLSNGKNINPVEIEQKLEHYAAFVQEAGVYLEKDMLRAIVVAAPDIPLEPGETLEKKLKWEVFDPYNQKVSPYKKVMQFTVIKEELPRTRLGKLRRFKLAELAHVGDQTIKPETKVDLPEFHLIKDYIEREKACRVRPQDHLEMDLGLDSLDKVSFQFFLQSSFGVELDIPDITGFKSVLALSEHIAATRSKMEVEKINWTKILKEKVHLHLPKTWFTGRWFVKFSKFFFRIYFRFKGKGLHNIPDEPCIIAPNHQSFFDGLFVASFLKRRVIKNTYFYAKEKHIQTRWLKFLAHRNNIIIMDLNRDLKASIQKMGEALKKKKNLIIFPEGTRTINGSLGDFKKTFAILSKELNVPIVPVSIKGAYDALPKGTRFPRPFKRVNVEFLQPVYPGKQTYEALSDLVFNSIYSSQLVKQ
jgi:long-chain acyl-CoA synthetase